MGIGALRDKAGQELGQCAGVWPGKPLLGLAVVEEHPRCELLAAVQERWDRSQRHNSSGQHCLAQQRIDQRALAAFELTKHGQVTALLSQPLQQLVEPGTIGLELRPSVPTRLSASFNKSGREEAPGVSLTIAVEFWCMMDFHLPKEDSTSEVPIWLAEHIPGVARAFIDRTLG